MGKKDETEQTQSSEQASAAGPSMVRKITNKALYSDSGEKPRLPEGKDSIFLGTVMGIARSVKTGQTDYGPWTKLVGQFEANTHDDRKVQSPECILPDPMQTMLAESLADENTNSIQFAVHVYMTKADTPVGFEYRTETVVDSGRADPLADLRRQALPSA